MVKRDATCLITPEVPTRERDQANIILPQFPLAEPTFTSLPTVLSGYITCIT